MAQLLTVRLNKGDSQPLGFRLQGGKDFGTPLVVQKVNVGSAAERAGLQAGDALIKVNGSDVYTLRHQEAQDTIRGSGPTLELTVQRGGGTWRPCVTPVGSLPRPGSRTLGGTPTPVTNTSLRATPQPSRAFGSGHNSTAKPFGYMNGNESVKSVVNKQYNTPVNMYSDQSIAETLSAQTEVLAGGVLGVNFKKNEKTYDAEKSAVFKVLQEAENDPEPEVGPPHAAPPVSGLRHVSAPVTRPEALNNTGGLPTGQNICEECERLITGVFVRIKDKNLHVECFKCATCGSSLKNQGYYNINGKLYCDIHAKLVARQQPPAPNLEPVTVPPGGRIPTNAFSSPLPPLSTNTGYTNGSSALFSPSSGVSGPRPYGSSGSAYSPASLSPRSAPLSPARAPLSPARPPVTAPLSPARPPFTAPIAPPTIEPQTNGSSKTDAKTPAEERLIRKMAKMALNGYEIGIQRRIKPADHIQSMADKIQDTVVTKHPLNTENVSSDESSREGTLRSSYRNGEKETKPSDSILSIGDKIKDTLISKHPSRFCNGDIPVPPPIPSINGQVQSKPINLVNGNIPAPPPPPNFNVKLSQPPSESSPMSPIPNFKVQKPLTPNFNALQSQLNRSNGTLKKPSDFIPKSNSTFISEYLNGHGKENGKLNGNGYSSSEDIIDSCSSNTLKKKNLFENVSIPNGSNNQQTSDVYRSEIKLNGDHNNTLSKRNIFEKKNTNTMNHQKDITKTYINGLSDTLKKDNTKSYSNGLSDTLKKINMFENRKKAEDAKPHAKSESPEKTLPSNLEDNTLYIPRIKPILNGECVFDSPNENKTNGSVDNTINGVNNDETDTVVRRRPKKEKYNDGRRDSHIITRPQSTMTSSVVVDEHHPPVCNVCDKTISRGPYITALGRIWCPEHFVCTAGGCGRELQDIGFVEEGGQLYCEFCFEKYIAPACDKCHAKIKGDCLNAIGKHFHPECFSCVYCGKLFGNNPFFLEDGLPYCEADWNELFTTKCFACGFPVEAGDRWVEALNNNYHSQCFNCTVCKKNLEGQSFFAKGGRPFCKLHAR